MLRPENREVTSLSNERMLVQVSRRHEARASFRRWLPSKTAASRPSAPLSVTKASLLDTVISVPGSAADAPPNCSIQKMS